MEENRPNQAQVSEERAQAIRFICAQAIARRNRKISIGNWQSCSKVSPANVDEAIGFLDVARSTGERIHDLVKKDPCATLFIAHWAWTQREVEKKTDAFLKPADHWLPFLDYLTRHDSLDPEKGEALSQILDFEKSEIYGADLCRKILELRERPPLDVADKCFQYLFERESSPTIFHRLAVFEAKTSGNRLPFIAHLVESQEGLARVVKMAEDIDYDEKYMGRLINGILDGFFLLGDENPSRGRCSQAVLQLCQKCIPQNKEGAGRVSHKDWPHWIKRLSECPAESFGGHEQVVMGLMIGLQDGSLTNLAINHSLRQNCVQSVLNLLCSLSADNDVMNFLFPILNSGNLDFVAYQQEVKEKGNFGFENTHSGNFGYCKLRISLIAPFLKAIFVSGGASDSLLKLLQENPTGIFAQGLMAMELGTINPPSSEAIAKTFSVGLYDLAHTLEGELRKSILRLALFISGPYGNLNQRILELQDQEECVEIVLGLCHGTIDHDLVGFVPLLLTLAEKGEQSGRGAFDCLSRYAEGLSDTAQKRFWKLDESLLRQHILDLRCNVGGEARYAFQELKKRKESGTMQQDESFVFCCLVHVIWADLNPKTTSPEITKVVTQQETVDILAKAYALGGDKWQEKALSLAHQVHLLFVV